MVKALKVVVAIGFGFLVVILFIAFYIGPPGHRVMNKLVDEGEVIIAKVNRYREENGSFPNSLSVLELKSISTNFGGWQYSRKSNGEGFGLWIGEYSEDLFTIVCDHTCSSRDDWYVDR